jgi:Polyketide cyclase / dehydrase and lipid transport
MAHPRARAHAENTIEARPAAVYAVLADYSTHHPRIMPESLFSNLEVETGGVGAGTVFHITLRILGRSQQLHMKVAEPEPGHVLTETNLDTGVVTMFTVLPADGGSRTLARISSEWETDGGLRGLIDRLATPVLMRRIFTRQLRELDRYMHSMEASKERPPLREGG